MTEKRAVLIKNKVAKSYAFWAAVFIALFIGISVIWVFLASLNLDA
jgi:hypothetical protein